MEDDAMTPDTYEDRRGVLDRRVESLEKQGTEHGYSLQRLQLEQAHMKELVDAKFQAVQAGQSTISAQISKLDTAVTGLATMRSEVNGVLKTLTWLGSGAILAAVLALIKAFIGIPGPTP